MRVRRVMLAPLLIAFGIGGGIAGASEARLGGSGSSDLTLDQPIQETRTLGCPELATVSKDAKRETIRAYEINVIPESGSVLVYGDDGASYEFGLGDHECIEASADVSGLVAGAISNYNEGMSTLCPSTLEDLGYKASEDGELAKRTPVPVGKGQDERFTAALGDLTADASRVISNLSVGTDILPSGVLRAPTAKWLKDACFGAP